MIVLIAKAQHEVTESHQEASKHQKASKESSVEERATHDSHHDQEETLNGTYPGYIRARDAGQEG